MEEKSDLPMVEGFLESHHLALLPLNPDHKDLYHRWMNIEKVRLYFGHSVPVSLSEIEHMFTESSMEKIQFEIWHKTDHLPIGMAKISGIHWIRRKCSIGALIGEKRYRGKGLGKEVTQLLINYIFGELNLNKVAAIVYSPNIASQKVVETLGFQLEARIGDAGYFNGQYCEDLYYVFYQKDWRKVSQL